MLAGMQELEWLIFRPMKPAKRRRRLMLARRYYEHRLTDVEASVVEIRAALELIEDALADFAPNSDMLGGKQGGADARQS